MITEMTPPPEPKGMPVTGDRPSFRAQTSTSPRAWWGAWLALWMVFLAPVVGNWWSPPWYQGRFQPGVILMFAALAVFPIVLWVLSPHAWPGADRKSVAALGIACIPVFLVVGLSGAFAACFRNARVEAVVRVVGSLVGLAISAGVSWRFGRSRPWPLAVGVVIAGAGIVVGAIWAARLGVQPCET